MSASTKQALDDAISAHFADEHDDAAVSGYVLQIVGVTIENVLDRSARYLRVTAEDQPLMTTTGLIEWVRLHLQQHILAP